MACFKISFCIHLQKWRQLNQEHFRLNIYAKFRRKDFSLSLDRTRRGRSYSGGPFRNSWSLSQDTCPAVGLNTDRSILQNVAGSFSLRQWTWPKYQSHLLKYKLLQSSKAEQTSVMMGGNETMYTLNVSQTIPLGQPPHLNSSFICQFNGSVSHKHQYFRDLQSCITLLTLQLLTNTTFCRYFLGCKVQLQILNPKLQKLWTTKWPCTEYLTFATF